MGNLQTNSIFHHPAWFSVLSKSYGLDVRIVGSAQSSSDSKSIEDRGEKIEDRSQKSEVGTSITSHQSSAEGGIPFVVKRNKYISLPFSDYVKLLNTKEENDSIISGIIKSNQNVEIEIRDKYERYGFESKLIGCKHLLLLINSEEEIFNSFKKTQVQQPILKALRDGLTASIKTDYESVMQFYKLHLLTRKKLGVPIQPKKFFYHLWNEIINNGLGFVVLVNLKGKVISSGIFAGYNKVLTYKFSASHPEYLKYRPNNLMLWTGIREAKKRGHEIFDFGRTDLETEGLRKFKLGWGTVEELLYYSYYPKVPKDSKYKFVKDKIVAPIIKQSPKFVCRLSGELLYKYFG